MNNNLLKAKIKRRENNLKQMYSEYSAKYDLEARKRNLKSLGIQKFTKGEWLAEYESYKLDHNGKAGARANTYIVKEQLYETTIREGKNLQRVARKLGKKFTIEQLRGSEMVEYKFNANNKKGYVVLKVPKQLIPFIDKLSEMDINSLGDYDEYKYLVDAIYGS